MNNDLNPQLTSSFDQIWGSKTPAAGAPLSSRANEIRALGKSSNTTVAPENNPDIYTKVNTIASNLGDTFNKGGQSVVSDIQNTPKTAADAGNSPIAKIASVGNTAGHIAGDIAGTAGGIIGSFISPFLPDSVKSKVGDVNKYVSDKVNSIPGMTPEIAKGLGDVFNTLSLEGGAKTEPIATDLAVKATDTAGNIASKTGEMVDKTISKINPLAEDSTKTLKQSIDAVNPELSGKKLTNAYKQSVTGSREATPPSIFREQGLSPDQQTVNLGTRLQDLKLGKDPVKNLNALKTGLSDTETKLTAALKGDPSLEFNADKPTLLTKLNTVKTQMPREFSSIKDSKSVFNNVVDFAKETVGKSEDTITGIRNARSAFDAQAKLEYPSAFKDGTIDIKTPAGRAIKTVRDAMNEHLYNTAPNGSELQKLIGREADIFKATETIASKAAKGHAQSLPGKIIKTIKDHPVISAASAYGVDKAVKATTGIGF